MSKTGCQAAVTLAAVMAACLTPSVASAHAGSRSSGHTSVASLAPPAATPPPDLVAFEQKAEALHVNSVKFSVLYEITLGSLPGASKGISLTVPIEGEGEMSVSPEEGFAKAGIFGLDTEMRVIGDTTYTRKSSAGHLDKGRPWVREVRKHSAASVDPFGIGGLVAVATTKGEAEEASPSGSFAGMTGVIAGVSSVTEVGPEIVNGSEATEFAMTLSPRKLLSGLST